MDYISKYVSSLGVITLASDGENLTGLWFDGQKYFADGLAVVHVERTLPLFKQTIDWLDCYFSGVNPDFTPPLSLSGTSFQLMVWEILRTIPYGGTVTYGDIASEVARRKGVKSVSAQAVGGAVGRNPISLIVPCHRVVGRNGSLTGYAGGISKKVELLRLEGVDMSRLFVPSKGTAL